MNTEWPLEFQRRNEFLLKMGVKFPVEKGMEFLWIYLLISTAVLLGNVRIPLSSDLAFSSFEVHLSSGE